jgi:hypothetical protein
MPKRPAKRASAGVSIGGSVDTGGGDIAGGDITKRDVIQSHGLKASEVRGLFSPIYQQIEQKESLPPEDREDLKVMVEEIETEAVKGEKADETLVGRHLRNIARMAPDILEVTLKTIASPALGLATLAQKISAKAGMELPTPEPPLKKKGPPS